MDLNDKQKQFFDQLMEMGNKGMTVNEAIMSIVTEAGFDPEQMKALKDAVTQLEEEKAKLEQDIKAKLDQTRREMYAPDGSYRGMFDSEDQARSFGLLCLANAKGAHADFEKTATRAAEALKSDYGDLAKRAMDSTTDGAIVTPEFSSRLVRLVESYGVFERNAFIMPMQGESLTFMRRTGGMTVFIVGENTAGSESQPSFGNIALNAKEWGTLTFVPRTLTEDSAAEIGELIAMEIVQAFAETTDDIGFNGDGSSTYFGIVGVREKLKGLSGTIANIAGLVVGSGNAYGELTIEDHTKVQGTLPQYAANNAQWYVSRTYFFSVMAKLMLAQGGVTAGEIEGRRRMLFGGDPVEITQKMPRTEANDQVCALYGDLRRAATVGRRRSMTIETSTDYKFAERQLTYLGTQRKAINVHDVGNASGTASERKAGPIVGLTTAGS